MTNGGTLKEVAAFSNNGVALSQSGFNLKDITEGLTKPSALSMSCWASVARILLMLFTTTVQCNADY